MHFHRMKFDKKLIADALKLQGEIVDIAIDDDEKIEITFQSSNANISRHARVYSNMKAGGLKMENDL